MDAIGDLRANQELLDQLMSWLTDAEKNLDALDKQPLPDNIPIIEQLYQDHEVTGLKVLCLCWTSRKITSNSEVVTFLKNK